MKQQSDFRTVKYSLQDFLGKDYVDAVCASRSYLSGESRADLNALARKKIDFFPKAFQKRLFSLLGQAGSVCVNPLAESKKGATSAKFEASTQRALSPLSGYGYYRIGEDGRLYLLTKSEHYHAPLGHSFPGYQLVDIARRFGIPNATHNNTRGHITRLLEEELVRTTNAIPDGDYDSLQKTITSKKPSVLNRVLNLETGSLAVEAGVKMMLARFYKPQSDSPEPKYAGRTPVFLVMGNDDGGLHANYHGTTVLTQTMRGMWPDLFGALRAANAYEVHAIRPNNLNDLEEAFSKYDSPPFKIAGFLHEIVMMNYGARLLSKKFLQGAYALCRKADVPTLVDEIQSCLWSPTLFLYREYGLQPAFVAVGKGFPGGEFPASRILFNSGMDNLPQFGALVTNGQEELASLAYLITMRWAEENAEATAQIGETFETRLRDIENKHKKILMGVEGKRHLAALNFRDLDLAKKFVKRLTDRGLDISAQTYKSDCPPATLMKLPLIMDMPAVEFVLGRIAGALEVCASL